MVMLSKEFIAQYASKRPPFGYGALGEIVYRRTYSRRIESENRNEEWYETVARCINGAQAIGADYTQEEAERLYDYMFNLKCTFGGRFLWQANTPLGLKYGDSFCNCWALPIKRPSDFVFLFHELLLGGGVGFSVRRADINELPKIKKGVQVIHEVAKDADFIVPDSREGWLTLLDNVLNSYFKTGKSFSYSTILVRGAGEPIKGFGGVASGPLPLIDGIQKIGAVCQSREGKKLRSTDVLDICNIIGSIVVSGNVRRSSQIAIGDADDVLFLQAKNWGKGNIPNWRAFSNNTIEADSYDYLTDLFWSGYDGSSEPYGLFNKRLAQTQGRLGEFVEDTCELPNPCAEVILEARESCNLAELFLNNITSLEELIDCAQLLYKTQKAIANMPYLDHESEEVIHRNNRLGLSVTGVCQSFDKLSWLSPTYEALKVFDAAWSDHRGWNRSIKLTANKPSGTLSLLGGATPGIHPALYQYYIRRVRMMSNDPLVTYCRDRGLHTEYVRRFDGTEDHNTSIVEFPCFAGENVITSESMNAIQQLELLKFMQTEWADNAVSVTIYYRLKELDEIREWLRNNYENSVKSVSFLLRSEHGFKQAPYEEITKDRYLEMTDTLALSQMLNQYTSDTSDVLELEECSTGACPVR